LELQRRATELARADGLVSEDKHFYAEQNARLVKTPKSIIARCFAGGLRRGTCAIRTWPKRWMPLRSTWPVKVPGQSGGMGA
jgi:hypothetical protein